MIPPHLKGRVGDLRQFASVRRITLDDGAERGVRALAFSTGGGLDFWVLSDRSLDIGPLWWRGRRWPGRDQRGSAIPPITTRKATTALASAAAFPASWSPADWTYPPSG